MDAELGRIAATLEKIEAALSRIAVVGFVPAKAQADFGTPEQEGAAAIAEPEKKRGPGRPRKPEAAPAPAQQTTEAPAQASPTPAPAPVAAAPAPKREVTQDQVREVLRTLAARDGREAAIAILTANGAQSVAALDKARFADVEQAAREALAKEAEL